ncbi:MAG: N-acetyl-gamma-glutamyl-phosphate reductase [Eubacteriales bacterium]
MKYNIFIDGSQGTTGLKIQERFEGREDVNLLTLAESERKDPASRKEMLNQADFVFLCLPDQAAREAVAMVENPSVKIIDASTAHRTLDDWAYGFPELSPKHLEKIQNSHRVAVPGCYASGFLSLVYPVVSQKILPADFPLTTFGISGYSGGGKEAIKMYEMDQRKKELSSPRMYALALGHKHLAEMQKIGGLSQKPLFTPIIDDYYAGMLVNIPLPYGSTGKTAEEIQGFFQEYYQNQEMIRVMPFLGEGVLEDGTLPANALENQDGLEIFVCGNQEQTLLTARLDNLGKGASAAAIQCMNLMMGVDPKRGLSW